MRRQSQRILINESSAIIYRGLQNILLSDNRKSWQVQQNTSLDNFNSICVNFNPDIVLINPLFYVQNQQLIDSSKKKYDFQLVAIIYNHYHSDILRNFDAQILIDDSKQKIMEILENLDYNMDSESSQIIVDTLSKREKEILKLIASGYASSKIAETLFISLHTVNTHRKNIMNKLDIKTVAGLTIYAVLNNIISLKEV